MLTLDGVQYQYKMTDCVPCMVLHANIGWCAVLLGLVLRRVLAHRTGFAKEACVSGSRSRSVRLREPQC